MFDYKELIANNKTYDSFLRTYLDKEKLRITHVILCILIGSYVAFFPVDFISANENVLMIMSLRIFAIFNQSLALFILNKKPDIFLKYYTQIMLYLYSVSCLSIIGMVYFSAPDELAYRTYYSGLMLIVAAVFSLTYINTRLLLILCLSMILIYALMYFYLKGERTIMHFQVTVNHVFFLLGAVLLGLVVDFLKKIHLYKILRTEYRIKELINKETFLYEEDNLQNTLNKMLVDSELCHLNVCVKHIASEKIENIETLNKLIKMSLYHKHYSYEIRKSEYIHCFLFDRKEKDTVYAIEKQIQSLLKNEKEKGLNFTYVNNYNFQKNDINELFSESEDRKKYSSPKVVKLR